jgi:hypothetical protein
MGKKLERGLTGGEEGENGFVCSKGLSTPATPLKYIIE